MRPTCWPRDAQQRRCVGEKSTSPTVQNENLIERFRESVSDSDSADVRFLVSGRDDRQPGADTPPMLGLWHLTVAQASELIAIDMWFEGRLDTRNPDSDSFAADDPRLLAALAPHSRKLQTRLVEAIEAGTLEPSVLRRGWDETLNPDLTLLAYNAVVEWLRVRGYTVGAGFQEYAFDEAKIHSLVVDEITFLRALKQSGFSPHDLPTQYRSTSTDSEPSELERMRAALRDAVLEKNSLREQLNNIESERVARADRPLTTRERRTLLTVNRCARSGS
jgi:hypothetical protein